ncbi:hypothetical protein HA402_008892 [Bradysia odoriphaga]|nr:hypothetical protein HA402_008892 [Bradysia odoriphaga]
MSDQKLILYSTDYSPPVRSVRVVAKLLGIELELRDVNLVGGEHLKEPFVKLNPEHTLPTLDDNGFILWDSQTICAYLVDKYGKDDSLYPRDLQLRAKCNQRLFFNGSTLFGRLRDISRPIYLGEYSEVPQRKIEEAYDNLNALEAFLENDLFLVGNQLTIADVCVALTIPFLLIHVPLKDDKHQKISAWLKRVSATIPFFDEMNSKYPEEHRIFITDLLEKNKQKK